MIQIKRGKRTNFFWTRTADLPISDSNNRTAIYKFRKNWQTATLTVSRNIWTSGCDPRSSPNHPRAASTNKQRVIYLRSNINIPASTAKIAIIAPRPLKYTAGTSATTPEIISQMPRSNIPTFFVKSMEIFLSLCVGCKWDESMSYYKSYFPFSVFSITIAL